MAFREVTKEEAAKRSFREIKPEEAAKRRAKKVEAKPPAPSRGQTIVRGLTRGIGELVDPAAQFVVDRLAFTPSPITTDLGSNTDIPEAQDHFGRDLESFSKGVGMAAPFAPFAAVAAPAIGLSPTAAVLGELGIGGLAGWTQDEMTDAGMPNLGMAAGGIIGMTSGSAAVPLTSARRAGGALLDTVRLNTPESLAMGKEFDLSRGALVRGSSELKRRTPDVTATIDAIRKATTQSQGAGLPYSASSRQIVEGMPHGRGGRFYTDAERNLTTTDVDYARDAAFRYAENATEIGNRWDRLTPAEPDFGQFLTSYDEGFDALQQAERDAWGLVREGDRPVFNTADMASQAKRIVGSVYFKRSAVPGAIKDLASGNMTVMNLDRFQELRSVLLGVVRDARKTGISKDKQAASMAVQMLKTMENKMDDFARTDTTGKSMEWANARNLTLSNSELYDPSSPVIQSLDSGGRAKNLFERVRTARGRKGVRTDPVKEATRLRRIAEQTPDGMDNLRALAAEDLFAEGFNPNAVRSPKKILEVNEDMYRVVFGDDYDKITELVSLAQLHTRGNPGVAAEAYRTGSGVSPAAYLFGLAKGSTNPIQAAVEGTLKLQGKRTARDLEWQKIVRTAIERPEFLRVLLEMPTGRSLPEWQVAWKKLVAQSSARSAARSGAQRATEGE